MDDKITFEYKLVISSIMMASLGKFENFQFSALINCYFFIFNRALRKHSLLAAFEVLLTKHGKLYLLHSCECREKFAR